MRNSTTNVYDLKREILNYCGKISCGEKRADQKFIADMVYGMLGSGSCLLTDIADKLHERLAAKDNTNRLKIAVLQTADPIRDKAAFQLYRIEKGISGILAYAQDGVKNFFSPLRIDQMQMRLRLPA